MKLPSNIEVQKFFGRLIAYVVVCVAIIAACILITEFAAPKEKVYTNESFNSFPANYIPPELNKSRYNVLLDQHSHTIYSDGLLTPEQNIIWHIKHGYNAAVITDHQAIDGAMEAQRIAREKYNDTFKVIVGEEWTNVRVHMNLIGIQQTVAPVLIVNATDDQIKTAIQETHRQGGLVVVNHIIWSGITPSFRDQLRSWGADYIEIVNENVLDNDSWAYCNSTGMGKITGTDMHSPTTVYSWTTLGVQHFTEQAILDQLKLKNTSFIYEKNGSKDYTLPPADNPVYHYVAPILYFGNAFENIYEGGTVTLIMGLVYLFAGFAVAEVLRVVKRQYWQYVNARQDPSKKKEGNT